MIVIRNYNDDDLDSVNNILDEAYSLNKSNFNNACFHEIVASIDDKVCGYLLMTKVLNPVLDKYYYLIDYVCVLSEFQRNGVGFKLLEYAEEIARSEDAIYLQLTCGYQREVAHRLYEKYGFVKKKSDLYRKELV